MQFIRLHRTLILLCSVTGFLCTSLNDAHAASHAITLFGAPKYPAEFAHFAYVNPTAPRGGTFTISYSSSFDSLNPFLLKGLPAPAVNTLVFQTLMTPSLDEPQTYYPLIAQDVTIAADDSAVDFTINPKARWNDGEPITAQDVIFSLDTLKNKGHPTYRVLYKDIASAEALSMRRVRFHFDEKGHRELPLYVASMPILPKHYYDKVAFDKTTLVAPIGSGPYRIAKVDAGRSITFERVKNYWADRLPSQRGMYNFEKIRIDVYRDDVVALEGIKSGQFDYYEEYIARNFATAYNIPAVARGDLIKVAIPNKIPRGMQGFIFNTRRAKFADPRVREAIGLTMDYEWMNQRLFYSAYTRTNSFFQNTEFAATDTPTGAELKLLEPFASILPKELFTESFYVPQTDGTGYARANLLRAQHLLDEAGWVMENGVRTNSVTGETLSIEFLMSQRTFERVVAIMRRNLDKLGIRSTFRYVDDSQYQKRVDNRDFDIVSIWWNLGTHFPGSEQYAYWHSSQADVEGAQNLGGIKNDAVDALVQDIAIAKTLEQLRPAARALDRVLLWHYYVIPHWYISNWRVIYWNKFGKPKLQPSYAVGALETWWIDTKKAATMQKHQSAPSRTNPTTQPQ